METLEQKKRKLIGKIKYLDKYIRTLNRIILKGVEPTMLLSVVETDNIYPLSLIYKTVNKRTLDFCDKKEEWGMIKDIFGNNPLYIWLTHGSECGLCPLKSIDLFNIDFDYEDDPEGIIVLITHDFSKKIVLDFYEESNGKKIDIIVKSIIKKK